MGVVLVLHDRLVAAGESIPHALYGLSYDRSLSIATAASLRNCERERTRSSTHGSFLDHPIVKPPDVRTAHRYPTTVGGLLRDAFRRGQLQATMLGRIEHG